MRAASIIRVMMEAARTSETSVDIDLRTRQYIPEDSELHTRRSENFKSHISQVSHFHTRHLENLKYQAVLCTVYACLNFELS
jgi:hypothetical protein